MQVLEVKTAFQTLRDILVFKISLMYSGNAVVSWQFSAEWTNVLGRHLCTQKFVLMPIVDIVISPNHRSRYLIVYFIRIWVFVSAETMRRAFFIDLFFAGLVARCARSVARVDGQLFAKTTQIEII